MLDKRYNLIDAYFASAGTAKRAASLGAVVDTQPMWFYKDGDALIEALVSRYMNTFIGVKTWKDNGVTVALNADDMQGFDPAGVLNPYHPLLAMQATITRKTQGGQVIGPAERISRRDVLRMTTINAAYIGFEEKKKGSIEVGKLADLAILTADFLTVPEDQIMNIKSYTARSSTAGSSSRRSRRGSGCSLTRPAAPGSLATPDDLSVRGRHEDTDRSRCGRGSRTPPSPWAARRTAPWRSRR